MFSFDIQSFLHIFIKNTDMISFTHLRIYTFTGFATY